MTFNVKVTGLAELDRQLKEFPIKLQRRAINSALTAAARPVTKQMKVLAPKDSGVLRRNIKARHQPKNKRSKRFTRVINVGVEHGKVRIRQLGKTNKGFSRGRGRGRGFKLRKLTRRERNNEDPFYYRFQEDGWVHVGTRKPVGGARRRASARADRVATGVSRGRPTRIAGKHFIRNSLPRAANQSIEAMRVSLAKFIDKQRAKR